MFNITYCSITQVFGVVYIKIYPKGKLVGYNLSEVCILLYTTLNNLCYGFIL